MAVGTSTSHHQSPQAKPVTVVIPFAPGGGTEQTLRHFEKFVGSKYNITFVPLFKGGAEGLLGMNELAGLPGNGYNISIATVGTVAVQRVKNPAVEVLPLSGIKASVMALITNSDSGIRSVDDLYNKDLNLAYGAPAQKIFLEQLVERSNKKIKGELVPFKGAAPVIQHILGNHVSIGVVPLQVVQKQIDNGSIRLLAVSGNSAIKGYEYAPAMSNLFPGWKNNEGIIFVVPKDIDPKAKEFWSNVLKEYLSDKNVQADFLEEKTMIFPFGAEALTPLISNAMDSIIKQQ